MISADDEISYSHFFKVGFIYMYTICVKTFILII